MIYAHVHLERGSYTPEWLNKFIETAQGRGINELYLLEHSHRFREFSNIYSSFRRYSIYQLDWLKTRTTRSIKEYQKFVEQCWEVQYPIQVKFGLEICYEEDYESGIKDITKSFGWDFLTGSVHWVDGWGFDHRKEFWENRDVDLICRQY